MIFSTARIQITSNPEEPLGTVHASSNSDSVTPAPAGLKDRIQELQVPCRGVVYAGAVGNRAARAATSRTASASARYRARKAAEFAQMRTAHAGGRH